MKYNAGMPIYEFLCRECETRFDDLVSMSDAPTATCPACGSSEVRRLLSAFAVGPGASAGGSSSASTGGSGGGCCGGGCCGHGGGGCAS